MHTDFAYSLFEIDTMVKGLDADEKNETLIALLHDLVVGIADYIVKDFFSLHFEILCGGRFVVGTDLAFLERFQEVDQELSPLGFEQLVHSLQVLLLIVVLLGVHSQVKHGIDFIIFF